MIGTSGLYLHWLAHLLFWPALFVSYYIVVSFRDRAQNMDTTGDPWNAHTLNGLHLLHRSTYNFAEVPVRVLTSTAFTDMKEKGQAYVRKETCSNPTWA